MADRSNSLFVCNGATGHALEDREKNDYYATHPVAGEWLMKLEPQLNNIWECCCGEGHLAQTFHKEGKLKFVSDLIDRGYHPGDFLKVNKVWSGDIVTNPPFCEKGFVDHALSLLQEGRYLALFMKITFLEGKSRRKLFEENPPIRVWVSSGRIPCAKGGDFEKYGKSSAACYCWYIWQKGYKGPTEIKWFN